jgi:hypothetical protein
MQHAYVVFLIAFIAVAPLQRASTVLVVSSAPSSIYHLHPTKTCTSTHITALKHSTTFCNQLTAEKRIFLDLAVRLRKAEI